MPTVDIRAALLHRFTRVRDLGGPAIRRKPYRYSWQALSFADILLSFIITVALMLQRQKDLDDTGGVPKQPPVTLRHGGAEPRMLRQRKRRFARVSTPVRDLEGPAEGPNLRKVRRQNT